MTGIADIFRLDGAPAVHGQREAMRAAMPHRRFDPPVANEDGSIELVLDGCIHNADDLRRELQAAAPMHGNGSDAELVLRAYEVWGEDCPDRLVGEWAFVIRDVRRREVFAARDAAGTRHFYYHLAGSTLAIASEIKGLLAGGRIEGRLNESRFLDFLVEEFGRIDEVGTMYQGINRLPAGHALRANAKGCSTWRYWQPGRLEEQRFASLEECGEAFMGVLDEAVRCRIQRSARVAATLSGGLDSSTIVALASRRHRSLLGERLRTYSLVLEDRARCGDAAAIAHMAQADDWLLPTLIRTARADQLVETLDADIAAADEPFSIVDAHPYGLAYQAAAADGCSAVLDGMAGDLMFYSLEKSLAKTLNAGGILPLASMLAAHHRHQWLRGGLQQAARATVRPLVPLAVRKSLQQRRAQARLGTGDLGLLHAGTATQLVLQREQQRHEAALARPQGSDQSEHAAWFTTGLLSFAHERNGAAAAAAGIEPLSPFSDRRMIEFAIRMPLEAKLAAPWYKHLLRSATAGLLPEPVRWRARIGEHPGRDLMDRLARRVLATREASANGVTSRALEQWVDPEVMQRLWTQASAPAGHDSRAQALKLLVGARWLVAKKLV